MVWETHAVQRTPDGQEETFELPDELKHWTLTEKFGTMSLEGIKEIADARLAGALFLYLWGEKKVPVAIAMRCARAHVLHYIVRPIDDDERDELRRMLGGEDL